MFWEDEMAARKKAGSRKKSSGRKYGKAAGKAVESAVRREKKGTLRSGKGGKGGAVKSRKQAIAIGLRNWAFGSTQEGCKSSEEVAVIKSWLFANKSRQPVTTFTESSSESY
jgi:Family of unknown function (DUF6496)